VNVYLDLVYFIFALETAQTALTGADAYYWFVGGFGQVERLRNAHFLPIDVFIICAVIQSIVLSYLCYRIWMLSGNLWVCTAITIVRVPICSRVLQALDVFLNADDSNWCNRGSMGGVRCKYKQIHRDV